MRDLRMPQGICILLYGERPGTGKTTSVYEIARKTRRDLIPVELAFKNKYYGESEQNIMKVFKNYAESVAKSDIMPILFINEADAIFTTRRKVSGSPTDQTDNAIQNILLDQMENLSGILIATTNLTINLDPAFERRFLFKILFDSPSIEAKQAIWKNKIPDLTDEDAGTLALKYDFSGGQIENIARRYQMIWILEGRHLDLNEIIDLCNKERLNKVGESRKIGYVQT
jgi:SpoVK/Ycf46/Vps4 family AAA+-type ATPase